MTGMFSIKSLEGAFSAIDVICSQGEGVSLANIFNQDGAISHFFAFLELFLDKNIVSVSSCKNEKDPIKGIKYILNLDGCVWDQDTKKKKDNIIVDLSKNKGII